MIEIQKEREMAADDQLQQVVQQAQGQGTPRREAWQVAHRLWREKAVRLSPRERKMRQQEAKKRDREQKDVPYQLWSMKKKGEAVDSD